MKLLHRVLGVAVPALIVGSTFAFAERTAEERAEEAGRLENLSREEQARLRQNAGYLLSLPATQRARILKLDQAMERMPRSRRESLEGTLDRYVAWLEQLPPEQRKLIENASDAKSKVEIIRQLRAQAWLNKQPATVRQQIASLPADKQAEQIRRLREQEQERRLEWLIARRFWNELARKTPLPSRLEEFPFRDLPHFVNEYLKPFLSPEEWSR
jgi:hypothetical protein